MRILYVFLIIILSLNFSNFKIDKNKSAKFTLSKKDTLVKKVILDDAEKEFYEFKNYSKENNKNLSFEVEISKPKLFRFYSSNPQTIPTTIYVSPDDKITFEIQKSFLVFKGKNSAHYNFFSHLIQSGNKYPFYSKEMDIYVFKTECFKIYQERIRFLEKYCKENKVSNSFKNRITEAIFFEYLNWILIPKKNIIDNPNFLNDIKVDVFNKCDLQDDVFYNLSLMKYINYTTLINSKKNEYSKDVFLFQLNYIENNFRKNVKEYAITKTLEDFFKNLNTETYEPLNNMLNNYSKLIKNKTYANVITQISEKIKNFKFKIPDEILYSKVTDLNQNSLTIKEILETNRNKIKVFDFWASWCTPCISDIKESYEFRNYLIKNKNVCFIYFSIDKNQNNWRKRVTQLEKYNLNENQYLIDESKTNIAEYLNVKQIPRYVILNKENEIFIINATSPKDSLSYQKILKEINSKQDE